MGSSLFVVAVFLIGCLIGVSSHSAYDLHPLSMYTLYLLMFTVGVSIGNNRDFKTIVRSFRPRMLLVPCATVVGTLAFSALSCLLLARWTAFDCMAVGSGFAYYSLSSLLITEFKTPLMGQQLAMELGAIALLANILREMVALVGAPLISRFFGKTALISVGGVNSMDVMLPSIIRYSGKEWMSVAILHGLLIDMSVPFFVSFFCSL